MEQINLEPLQVFWTSEIAEVILDMTPEEYEQWQKKISARIKKIEKKALKRLRNRRRESLRDYIEK